MAIPFVTATPPCTNWLPLHWLVTPRCPLCQGAADRCRCDAANLPAGGLRGTWPMAWWAAGAYQGTLRAVILQLKHQPRARTLTWLVERTLPALPPLAQPPLLVPIPSWKRSQRANQVPGHLAQLAARRLGGQALNLLEHTRPVLGQHLLGRPLRQANQCGAFRCTLAPQGFQHRRPLLLVDDVLTTGATALAAADVLQQTGWNVLGLFCLARTPEREQR